MRLEAIAKAGYYPTPPSVVERVAALTWHRPSSLLLTRTLEGLTVLLVILDVVPKSGYRHLRQEKLKGGARLARDGSSLTD